MNSRIDPSKRSYVGSKSVYAYGQENHSRIPKQAIACNIWYDYDSFRERKLSSDQSALGVLRNRLAVCGGYVNLTLALLTAVDIHAIRITGVYESETHAWIEAYVSDRWIHMDTTFASNNIFENGSYGTRTDCGVLTVDFLRQVLGLEEHEYPLELDIEQWLSQFDNPFTYVISKYTPIVFSPFMQLLASLLDGAAIWARPELRYAVGAELLSESMYGNWSQPTSRLLAAEAIVKLIEVSSGKTIEQIAEEKGYNMNDPFSDTDSKYATFLKAAGVSAGIGDNRYDPTGTFTRIAMVTMLGRVATNIFGMDLSGYPLGTDVFSDVPDWAGTNEAVGWAAEIGITTGVGDGLFDSNGVLQNQHIGVFAYRAFEKAFSN